MTDNIIHMGPRLAVSNSGGSEESFTVPPPTEEDWKDLGYGKGLKGYAVITINEDNSLNFLMHGLTTERLVHMMELVKHIKMEHTIYGDRE